MNDYNEFKKYAKGHHGISGLNLHRYEFAGLKMNGLKEGKFRKISKKDFSRVLVNKKNNKY